MKLEGDWFSETHTDDLLYSYKVEERIYSGRTRFQRVDILRIKPFGITLFLDGKLQSARVDEAVYHECLVHPAMQAHPNPKRVFIAGGGEGATLREVLRYPVEECVMCDIDPELVELCEAFLPSWNAGAFRDQRARLLFADARATLANSPDKYDVIISDLPEPLEAGPARFLYTKEFYQIVRERLSDQGVFVAQVGSADPVYPDLSVCVHATLSEVFPVVGLYVAYVFSFQLLWAFVLATKGPPLSPERFRDIPGLSHYTPDIHRAMFALPGHMRRAIKEKGRILTDEKPFSWTA
ncbi:MAG: fused MFS/spermidine synthase [candidate division WOR-3 bacterium]